MDSPDAIVLGAGPSGLGAALSLARSGVRVTLLDGAPTVGGLCVTRRRGELAYDIGGHILFVRDRARADWLRDLLGDELRWVGRPVSCVRDGRVVPGRYLDQRPTGATGEPAPPRMDQGGADYLTAIVDADFRDRVMRPYLEKVDGMALEDIPAGRIDRLLVGQAAPEGFFYPADGIGALMDAMVAEIVVRGGAVRTGFPVRSIDISGTGVTGVTSTDGTRLTAPRVVVGLPAVRAIRLVDPPAPSAVLPRLRMRAVALVYLEIPGDRLTEEPWIQVDDPTVPFARLFEPANWSDRLVPPRRTVVCCECYCLSEASDPVWSRSDEELARWCAEALAMPLGLLPDPGPATLIEVVRIPAAYPLAPVADLSAALGPARWLDGVGGLSVAQGGAVIEAIEAGERAAGA